MKQKIIVGIFIGFALSMTTQVEASGLVGGSLKFIAKLPTKGNANKIDHEVDAIWGKIGLEGGQQCINRMIRKNDNTDNIAGKRAVNNDYKKSILHSQTQRNSIYRYLRPTADSNKFVDKGNNLERQRVNDPSICK